MRNTRNEPEILLLARDQSLEPQVRQALRGYHIQVSTVDGPDGCRRALQSERPQLLVLEQACVSANWRTAVQEALAAEVPVVAITARFDSRQWVELFKAGVLDILSPPLPAHRLQNLVESIFGCAWNERPNGDIRALAALRRVGAWLGL